MDKGNQHHKTDLWDKQLPKQITLSSFYDAVTVPSLVHIRFLTLLWSAMARCMASCYRFYPLALSSRAGFPSHGINHDTSRPEPDTNGPFY